MSGRASLHAGFSSEAGSPGYLQAFITTDMFDINTTLFELLGYRMSLLELLAVITGLLATWFAARANIVTWIFAIINAVLFFRLYYQVNLYSAMSLQLFFFGNAIYGWFNWRRQTSDTDEPVTLLSHRERISWAAVLIISAMALGTIMGRIHIWLPDLFPERATFIYIDAMIAVMSIGASLLCARLKLENWVLWILLNVMSIALYSIKGIMLVSMQYVIFLVMAVYGFIHWQKKIAVARAS
ncbi:MAG: Nicotinamide riboside transporter PnuC [Bacteroidetes bacterium ADurb.Bin008]|nr:MAG: Nicotinamide riboside transporter PnuC [Bacteroidetes bacterium ADurb.Bin008]